MPVEQSDDLRQSTLLRTFGPDDLESDADLGATPSKGEFEMVLGPKQLSIALFLLLAQTGLVAGIAYTVGRASAATPAKVTATAASVVPVAAPAATPVATTVVVPPAPVVAEPTPVATTASDLTPPSGLYLQVGSLELTPARMSVTTLTGQGFQARLAPGSADSVFRVLVGPVPDGHVKDVTAAITAAGYVSFPKRY